MPAWSGPLPPNTTSTSGRGSMPRPAETLRTAFAMLAFTRRKMPSAASRTEMPSGTATRSRSAACARSTSRRICPSEKRSGLR